MGTNSALTAIKRIALSAPARYLLEHGLLKGRILDFGCGRGDVKKFTHLLNVEQWDPYFFPRTPTGVFDTIYCGYVLNVLPKEQWLDVLLHLYRLLSPQGIAYIAVRRDIKKEGRTARGTEQYTVHLPHQVLVDNARFALYILRKDF
jgi:ATP adenylyltransferase